MACLFHRIDQAHSVDEFTVPFAKRLIEARQVLGPDGKIGIQNHENVAACLRETQPHGVCLADPGLPENRPHP